MKFLEQNYKFLYKKYSESIISDKVTEYTSVDKKIQFGLVTLMALYYLAFGIALQYFSVLFSLLYPAFQSFISLESEEAAEQRRMLLTYWIIISCLMTLETIGWFALRLIPMYYLLKVFFVYWLISPQTKGCFYVYQKFIESHLKKNRKQIEDFLSNTENSLSDISSKIVKNINKENEKND
ncbi:TB2/DP1, HVA22 family [seawater metagenome]|uniref:TB2/DP1, HVA22 family n=1 Tax=seawater metagenome TaxID=1561972 RepID=A0A5E8CM96_9ZZZZ